MERLQEIRELLTSTTVKIGGGKNWYLGTGFFLTPQKVITCGHCIPDGVTEIEMEYQRTKFSVRPDLVQKFGYDLALIDLSGLSLPVSSLPILDADVPPHSSVFATGYSKEHPRGDQATAKFEGFSEEENTTLLKFSEGNFIHGFSGAPLLNENTLSVCGILVESRHTRIKQKDQDTKLTLLTDLGAYAISVNDIFKHFPDLLQQNEAYHQINQSKWYRIKNDIGNVDEEADTNNSYHDLSEPSQRDIYLKSVKSHLEDLNRPLNFNVEEFTTQTGKFNNQETVKLKIFWRKSKGEDRKGFNAIDILNFEKKTDEIENVYKTLIDSDLPVILLGEPGSGKSVTLRKFALDVIEDQKNDLLPIYLQLGTYRQKYKNRKPVSLNRFIEESFSKNNNLFGGTTIDNIDQLIKRNKIVFLFDAMDEMPSYDYSDRVQEIQSFISKYSGFCKIVIACRIREYAGDLPHSELIIEPFDDKKIVEYLDNNWRCYAHQVFSSGDTEKSRHYKKFLEITHRKHPLNSIASNPFFLKLTTLFFYANNGKYPDNQALIFSDYLDRKLEREIDRGLAKDKKKIQDVLGMISYLMIRKNLGGTLNLLTDLDKLDPVFDKYDIGDLKTTIEVAIHSRILIADDNSNVRFEHHRLLEYLAAYYWEHYSEEREIDIVSLSNPWFRETLIIRCGIIEHKDQFIGDIFEKVKEAYEDLGLDAGDNQASFHQRLDLVTQFELLLTCCVHYQGQISKSQIQKIIQFSSQVCELGVLEKIRILRYLFKLDTPEGNDLIREIIQTKSLTLSRFILKQIFESDFEIERKIQFIHYMMRVQPDAFSVLSILSFPTSILKELLWRKEFILFVITNWIFVSFLSLSFIITSAFYEILSKITLGFVLVFGTGLIIFEFMEKKFFKLFVITLVIFGIMYFKQGLLFGSLFLGFVVLSLSERRALYLQTKWYEKSILAQLGMIFTFNWVYRIVILALVIRTFTNFDFYYRASLGVSIEKLYTVAVLMLMGAIFDGILFAFKRGQIVFNSKVLEDERPTTQFEYFVNQIKKPNFLRNYTLVLAKIKGLSLTESTGISRLSIELKDGKFFVEPDEIISIIENLDLRRKQKNFSKKESTPKVQFRARESEDVIEVETKDPLEEQFQQVQNYFRQNNFEEVIKAGKRFSFHYKSLSREQQLDDKDWYAEVCSKVGKMYSEQSDFPSDPARRNLQEAHELLLQLSKEESLPLNLICENTYFYVTELNKDIVKGVAKLFNNNRKNKSRLKSIFRELDELNRQEELEEEPYYQKLKDMMVTI